MPPLDYGRAGQLATDYPDLDIILNGGLETLEDIQSATEAGLFCGVMIGRAAYKTPRQLGYISSALFGHEMADLSHIAQQMSDYAEKEIEKGVRMHNITRHMLGLFTGLKGARTWRRTLGEQARDNPTAAALIAQTAQTCLDLQGDTTNRKVA